MVDGANFLPLSEICNIENVTEIELAGLHTDKGAKYTVNNHVYRVRVNIDFTISFKSITRLNAILKFFCDFKEIEGKNLKQTDVLSLFTVVILNNSTTEQTRTKYLFSGSISNDIKASVLYKLTDEQLFNCIDEFIDTFHRFELPPAPCDRYVSKEPEVEKRLHDFIESLKLLPDTRLNTFVKLMAQKLNTQKPKVYIIGVDTFFLMIMSELSIEQNIIFNKEIRFSSIVTPVVLFYSDKTIEELEKNKQIILLLAFSSTKKIFELIDAIDKCNDDFQSIPILMAQGVKFKLLLVRAKLEAGVTPPLLNEVSQYVKGLSADRAYSSTCSERIFENKDKSRVAINRIIPFFYTGFGANFNAGFEAGICAVDSKTMISDMIEVSLQHPDFAPFAPFFNDGKPELTLWFAQECWITCSKRILEECRLMESDFDENKLTASKLISSGLMFYYLKYICESMIPNKVLCIEQVFSTLTSQQIKDICRSNKLNKRFVTEFNKIASSESSKRFASGLSKCFSSEFSECLLSEFSKRFSSEFSKRFLLKVIIPTIIIDSSALEDEKCSAIKALLEKCPTLYIECLFELPAYISRKLTLLIYGNHDEILDPILFPSKNHSIAAQVELVLLSNFSLLAKLNFIILCFDYSKEPAPLSSMFLQLPPKSADMLLLLFFPANSEAISDIMQASFQNPYLEPFASFLRYGDVDDTGFQFRYAEECWKACSKRISEECRLMDGDFDENKLTVRKLISSALMFHYLSYICESMCPNKALCLEQVLSTLTCKEIKDLCNPIKSCLVEKIIPTIINSSAQTDEKDSAIKVIITLLEKRPTLYIECLFVLPKDISRKLTLLIYRYPDETLNTFLFPSNNYSIAAQVKLVLLSLFSLPVKRNFIKHCLDDFSLDDSSGEDPLTSLCSQLSQENAEILRRLLYPKKLSLVN